ncbi:MAG: Gfo/Idh/MocA family oxidoreductase [Chloroflexi bacterium]|jgi:predicted dehydrogenase|nr:Gfo/Idh/MocA family oxidoreductase [Chloroflexota bacterium]
MGNALKAGIVGYGYMGQIRKTVIEEHPNLELSAICDANLLLADSDFGCPIFTDYRDILEKDVDIVFVCTPNAFSPEIVISSLNQGKHVFCEKPPGRSIDDIRDIIEAEKANTPAKLMFGFNHRYHPCVNEAKVLVDSGRYGKILSLRGVYGKSGGLGFEDSWRNKKEISGGGILLDQGIHMMDLFRLFCGDFQEVKGFVTNSYWNIDMEDNAFAMLRNEQGQVATLHSSATLWKHTFRLEVFMEQGYFVISGLLSKTGSYGRETLVVGKRQFEDETFALGNPREEVTYFDRDLSWITEVSDFVDCIQNDKCVTNSSSTDALKVMELIGRIYGDDPKYKVERFGGGGE